MENSNSISSLKDVLATHCHFKSRVGVAGGLGRGVERTCFVGLLPDKNSRGPG